MSKEATHGCQSWTACYVYGLAIAAAIWAGASASTLLFQAG